MENTGFDLRSINPAQEDNERPDDFQETNLGGNRLYESSPLTHYFPRDRYTDLVINEDEDDQNRLRKLRGETREKRGKLRLLYS